MAAPAIRDYVETAAARGTGGTSPQSYDVTLPTFDAGDLCIIHLAINATSFAAPGAPTGWTQQDNWIVAGSGLAIKTATFTRIMDGTEGATVHFSEVSFFEYRWKGVASSWQDVDASTPVSTPSSATSNIGQMSTWALGTISGTFTGAGHAYWGGQYLKVNSNDGISYTEMATLTTQLIDTGATDISTAFAADYDVLDSSGLVSGTTNGVRLVLARQATTPGQGARIWARF
jgi:hypothetical protein